MSTYNEILPCKYKARTSARTEHDLYIQLILRAGILRLRHLDLFLLKYSSHRNVHMAISLLPLNFLRRKHVDFSTAPIC